MALKPLIKPHKPALATRLALQLAPEPRRRWAGKLKGKRGAARGRTVYLTADIRFLADVIDGRGCTPQFPSSAPGSAFDLDGVRTANGVDFALWFEEASVSKTPFTCVGKVDANLRNIRGDWTVSCFNPDSCGCDGASGAFHFWRLD